MDGVIEQLPWIPVAQPVDETRSTCLKTVSTSHYRATRHWTCTPTLTHYITTLPQRVSLSGQWECGLVEIQYPHTWYNVRKENSWFAIVNGSEGSYDIDKGNTEVGYYDRPERLITAINRSLKVASDKKNVTLSYSKITQKVTVDLDPGMMLSMDMSNILGFNKFLIRTAREGDSVVDMAQGFYSLYVYTNVVESRVVGHSVVPLLRIVPLEGKHGDVVSKSFDNVQYIPLIKKIRHTNLYSITL